jgi:BCCT family betaine/carnitine transporter
LSITLGLSVPLLSQGIARVLGIESSFTLNLILVALISVAFTLSAYLGIEKGVRRVTNFNTILAIIFVALILAIGPTLFIIDSSVNALGLMFNNFIHMSLWTSPVAGDSFPKSWTMFYWLYWITYTPFMGIFVARISKGRRIKEVIMNMLITGSVGCWVFFGILENFSMDANIKQLVDVAGNLSVDGGNAAILNVMSLLPAPSLFILFFVVVSMLFLVSTLDSASYTLAATATRHLSNHQDPGPGHRVFWCVMVTVMPLMMIFIDAPLDTIKTAAIVTAIPLLVVLVIMNYGMIRWMREDYGDVSREAIRNAGVR